MYLNEHTFIVINSTNSRNTIEISILKGYFGNILQLTSVQEILLDLVN